MRHLIPSSRAYKISDGLVQTLELPDDHSFRIRKVEFSDEYGNQTPFSLLSGTEDVNYRDFSLPRVARIATRLTPWSTWYLAPRYSGCEDSDGLAFREIAIAVCRTTFKTNYAMSLALHEAWHLCELLIRDDLISELDFRLAKGPTWPDDYDADTSERRARAFAGFSMLIVESPGLLDNFREQVADGSAAPEIRIFYHVISGCFGREIMRLRNEQNGRRAIVKGIRSLEMA